MLTCKRALSLSALLLLLCLMLTRLVHHPREEKTLRDHLSLLFPYNPAADLPKHIWQTWISAPSQKRLAIPQGDSSWITLNPDLKHEYVTGEAASSVIAQLYSRVPAVPQAFEALEKPILKADFFRYLILLARGGIYSDIDTTALKPAAHWIPPDMQPYGLAVGIEADADRPDWHDWFAHRVQFCQWTIVSKPGHPVLIDVVASITEETLNRKSLGEVKQVTLTDVLEFTGPGIWTDSLFKFFNRPRYHKGDISKPRNVTWEHFANLTQPMKESDVVVLPITSFSPGVGHMGSQPTSDPLAFVYHRFSGTWKNDMSADRTEEVST